MAETSARRLVGNKEITSDDIRRLKELNRDEPPMRFKVKGKAELLFADENSKQTLIEWIDNLTEQKTTREVIDRHYNELMNIYKGEMHKHLKCLSATKSSKKNVPS